MRKYVAIAVAAVTVLGVAVPVGATGLNLHTSDKVNICHKTSSETNPWEAIRIDENAHDTHIGHGDFDYAGPVKENGHPTKDGDEWCEENMPEEPTDVCVNIEGVQKEVPEGKVKDEQGNCVEPTPEPNPTPAPAPSPSPTTLPEVGNVTTVFEGK